MAGHYRTDTDIYGFSSLYITGTLLAPYKLNPSNQHYCVFAVGNKVVTEKLFSSYQPSVDSTGAKTGKYIVSNISSTASQAVGEAQRKNE